MNAILDRGQRRFRSWPRRSASPQDRVEFTSSLSSTRHAAARGSPASLASLTWRGEDASGQSGNSLARLFQ